MNARRAAAGGAARDQRPDPAGKDATARRAGGGYDDIRDRLRTLTLRQQRFERYLGREMRVDAAGLAVMDHLVANGPATPTDLARRLDASTAATTLVIDRLVAGGHASRAPHPTDRRKVVVSPAEDWEASAFEHVSPIVRGVNEAVESLSEQERATVAAFLDRVVKAYDDAIRP
ncbi:MarR family winged helix-turn-helix transcriptional regulator [Embleya scabrispora]|uniref:MarR family winged helix-turn-helix transcriptional regulator n=1 Tax=Embleya scabrispora TaxID=159449 RepID=UPI000360C25C|nr:MarR family transcriptional regulator [Embleya scabrispora]MYS86171.1 MarR family transcriptional regulator [Streptomyces sp. SID5474]